LRAKAMVLVVITRHPAAAFSAGHWGFRECFDGAKAVTCRQ